MKDRLNAIIEQKGLTATRFATLIDANPSAISHLLKGRNKPGYDLLVNIAKAFPDISMDWLLTGKGEMYVSAGGSSKNEAEKKTITTAEKAEKDLREVAPVVAAIVPPVNNGKELKRIILFFSDGSFEDYNK